MAVEPLERKKRTGFKRPTLEAPKPKWGVVVKREKPWKNKGEIEYDMDYSIKIKKGREGDKGFFTHDKLHDVIKNMIKNKELEDGQKIGSAMIGAHHEENLFEIWKFYPLTPEETSTVTHSKLEGKGIATHMQKEIVNDLKKAVKKHMEKKEYEIKYSDYLSISPKMQDYLEKRGIDPYEEHTLDKYLEKLDSRSIWQRVKGRLGLSAAET
jgi:hypothetical protein